MGKNFLSRVWVWVGKQYLLLTRFGFGFVNGLILRSRYDIGYPYPYFGYTLFTGSANIVSQEVHHSRDPVCYERPVFGDVYASTRVYMNVRCYAVRITIEKD